jgi:hypothetical protein
MILCYNTMATHGPKQKYYSKLRLREWGWSYNCFLSLRILHAHYLAKNFLNVALLELYNEPIHPAASRFACRINIAMCCIHVHMLDDDASCCKVCRFFVVSLFPVAAKLTTDYILKCSNIGIQLCVDNIWTYIELYNVFQGLEIPCGLLT